MMESGQWESRKVNNSVIRRNVRLLILTSNSVQRQLLHAVDTERARDHGLGSYNDYREACGLQRMYGFSELQNLINTEVIISHLQ